MLMGLNTPYRTWGTFALHTPIVIAVRYIKFS